jgi:RND family efflux transporter MFP subunit
VEVAAVAPSTARLQLVLPGEVQGSRDATLAAALGGYVEDVRVREGQAVRRGQALVLVDASLHAAAAEQALAQAEQAEAEAGRVRRLGDLASASQLQAAETSARVAAAALDAAEVRHRRAVISAPFDGVVASVAVETGEVAGPGAPVARLVDLDPVEIELAASDRDVVALREGMEVSVTTQAQATPRTGTVVHIGPAAETTSRSFPVHVTVDNPDGALLPGMVASVALERTAAEDAVVLPQDWLVTRREDRGVFVEEGGVARWRHLDLGAVVRDQVLVEGGLEPGDRVVFVGHRDLVDGDPILVSREATCCNDGRPVYE